MALLFTKRMVMVLMISSSTENQISIIVTILPSGSYFYIFSYIDQSSQETIVKKGVLTLINN